MGAVAAEGPGAGAGTGAGAGAVLAAKHEWHNELAYTLHHGPCTYSQTCLWPISGI
jgi:hypothetical protein